MAFKPHDAYDWWYETISDPETRRYAHKEPYFVPTDEDFQVREFQVKIKTFNLKGDGPYSLTKVIYYPRDGEDLFSLDLILSVSSFYCFSHSFVRHQQCPQRLQQMSMPGQCPPLKLWSGGCQWSTLERACSSTLRDIRYH